MLHVHRAERADRLIEALGELMAKPLEDPLASEVVGVPTRGVERWLAQRLSTRLGAAAGRTDGICANVEFPFPGRLVGGAVAAAVGVDRDTDPWLPERSVWPLIEVVDASLAEPWLASLAAHLGVTGPDSDPEETRRGRRFGAVRHLADLFDRYGVHRPEMLRAWAVGEDTDGAGHPLPPEAAWQAELWRRLRERVGSPSPAERLEEACERLRREPEALSLPERVSLFGLTRLPASYLDVLRALAAAREIHLFLLHPSPALWTRVAAATAGSSRILRRDDDPTASLPRNPLLASWGRDAREMQLILGGDGDADGDHGALEEAPTTLLRRIQADVRADRSAPGAPLPGGEDLRALLDPDDRSLQVHACHGRSRQVEVLRDAVLHLLAADPSLEPRDVIVMCPDIETFAPLIQATFGVGEADGDSEGDRSGTTRPPDLRVRLADRSLRQTNPVLGVVSELIGLASARVTASQLLDLASREPVRRRFRLDDDDLDRLDEWAAGAGIRWGLDAAWRAPFRLEDVEANTWRAGLDRILLGVAMAEEDQRLVGGVLPLDDVEGGAIDLAGRLAELVDRLGTALEGLRQTRPVESWLQAIAHAADLLTETGESEAWQRTQLDRILDDVRAEAAAAGVGATLALPEVRALLDDRLRGRPTRANFRTGHLTVCTLVPMRSVPHRVVCLLGLDDGAFPRHAGRDGDDIVLLDPHVGDRDARSEDRQLLLDALLAATDHLVITYTARDERTNLERPPAVPVGELLDVVDRTARTGELAAGGIAPPSRERVLVRHPLQPFDPRNFAAGALVPGRTWSFDEVALAGARALVGPRRASSPFLAGPLSAPDAEVVELDALVTFVQHPVRAFLSQRLGVSLRDHDENVDDALPVELDGLARWSVGQRLLEARLAGAGWDTCAAAEVARGTLPPGALALPVLQSVQTDVEALVAAAEEVADGSGEPASVEVNMRLPDGRALIGTVSGVKGALLRTATFSRVAESHRLGAWVRLLAMTAARPESPLQAVIVGRCRDGGPRGRRVTVARIALPEDDPAQRRELALRHLAVLVDLHDRGLREPLPLYCATSAAYAAAAEAGGDPRAAARKAWESEWNRDREDRDPEHQLVLGGEVGFEELLVEAPRDDECGEGWAEAETSRLGRYARRLWGGVLEREELTDR